LASLAENEIRNQANFVSACKIHKDCIPFVSPGFRTPADLVVVQFQQHFISSFRTGALAVEESALAGQKQIPRAIKLRFGMTTFSSCTYR
jgi:hypothetical protein